MLIRWPAVIAELPDIKKGYLYIFFTSLLFGVNTLGIRSYFNHFKNETPENVAFWGMLGAVLIISPLYLFSSRSRRRLASSVRRDGLVILVVAVLSTIGAYLWLSALQVVAAGPVSLLAKSQVIFTALLGTVFLRERFTAFELAGVGLALSGIIVISSLGSEVAPEGVVLVLISSSIYSFQSLLVKKFAPGLSGLEFTWLRALLMVLFFLTAFTYHGTLVILPLDRIVLLGVISVAGLMIGRSFYYEAHKYLGISRLSIGMLLEPVFVLFVALVFMGELFHADKITGAVLILTGLYMTAVKNLRYESLPGFIKRMLKG